MLFKQNRTETKKVEKSQTQQLGESYSQITDLKIKKRKTDRY